MTLQKFYKNCSYREDKHTLLRMWMGLSDRHTFLDMINTRHSKRDSAIIVVPTPRLRPQRPQIPPPPPPDKGKQFSSFPKHPERLRNLAQPLVIWYWCFLKIQIGQVLNFTTDFQLVSKIGMSRDTCIPLCLYIGRGANLPITREKYFAAM